MLITFLSTAVPLTKTITLRDGKIHKDNYPLQNKFTSNSIEITTLAKLFEAIKATSQHPAKPCLLKGTIAHELINESRKGMTKTNMLTDWMCHDLDRAAFNTPDEYMKAVGLQDVSYIVQYSSSYKLDKKDKTLSCHIFCLLSEPRPANDLKSWLMHLNLTTEALKQALTLSNSHVALHWPLDITCSQNDKLIYIAEPTFVGMKSPIPNDQRIQLVSRTFDAIPIEMIILKPMDALKKEQRRILNELQTTAGVSLTKNKTKMVGEYEVQTGVSEIAQYHVTDCNEYNRIDLNGGDSHAYYHRKDDLTYLHNFKGEPSVLLKEILPTYYADLVRARDTQNATPNEGGDILLAYRDKITSDYYKGAWNPANKTLELYRVKSRDMLQDFLLSHGRDLGPFVPEWRTIFNPQSEIVVDEANHVVNRFVPGYYMHKENQTKGAYSVIQRLLDSAVGTGPIQDHFINWLACLFQFQKKPLTAWILHGTYGTGKGLLINKVIAPLLGHNYVHQMRASELNEQYNGWLENSLLVFIDEISADMFINTKATESNLFNFITEPFATIRRMRTDTYKVPNFTGFILASNKNQPTHIPLGDRRFNVGSFQHDRFFPTEQELNTLSSNEELTAFAYFLQNYKADLSKASKIMQTEERTAIQKLGVTSIDQLANDLLGGHLCGLLEVLPDMQLMNQMGVINPTSAAYTNLVERFSTEHTSCITRDELAVLFTHCIGKVPEGANKFTSFLRHHGIHTRVLRIKDHTPRGIMVEWIVTDEDREYIATTFKPKNIKLKAVK